MKERQREREIKRQAGRIVVRQRKPCCNQSYNIDEVAAHVKRAEHVFRVRKRVCRFSSCGVPDYIIAQSACVLTRKPCKCASLSGYLFLAATSV